MNLTPEQRLIVAHAGGHTKVSAVAGSGKTTTMVARIRRLLEQGVTANHIMVLMFNRSARDSFCATLNAALQPVGLAAPEVRTFHALGLRLVESFTRRGALPARTLLTADYQLEKYAKEAMKKALEACDDSREWLAKENLEAFLTFIDLVKAGTLPAAILFDDLRLDNDLAYFIDAFALFEETRNEQGIRFFADLIHEPVMAMLADPSLAQWVGNRVEHIIVDEYQDINEVQQQLLRTIAGSRAKVMVVGDVDQCIYEWRGARPEYITDRFQHDFQNPTDYTLSYTFRFGHRLSLAANHLLRNNLLRDRKLCLSCPGSRDTELHCLPEGEVHPILAILDGWQQQGRSLREAAALVRLFAMSVPLELALLEAGIPYTLLGHERVFQCPEIMALTGFLSLIHGRREMTPESAEAMLSNPHLGLKREKLETLARSIAANPRQAPELILGQISRDTPPFIKRQMESRAVAWKEIQGLPTSTKAHDLLSVVINKTGLFEFYHSFSTRLSQAENRIRTCQAFLGFARRRNCSLAPFLDEIDRLRHAATPEPEANALLITSIHRAKGLEWPLVIVPGLSDGAFPLLDDQPESVLANQEDERRLCYVAMTRAREQLFLLHPPDPRLLKQQESGTGHFITPEDDTPRASRFLYEANLGLSSRLGAALHAEPAERKGVFASDCETANSYLTAIGSSLPPVCPPARKKSDARQRTNKDAYLPISEIAEGMMVVHRTFGTGVVTRVPDRSQGKVEVQFPGQGKKVLIAHIAKLEAL